MGVTLVQAQSGKAARGAPAVARLHAEAPRFPRTPLPVVRSRASLHGVWRTLEEVLSYKYDGPQKPPALSNYNNSTASSHYVFFLDTSAQADRLSATKVQSHTQGILRLPLPDARIYV